MEEFPMTITGKIQKYLLREQMARVLRPENTLTAPQHVSG